MNYNELYSRLEKEVRNSGDLKLNIENFMERIAYSTDVLSIKQISEIYDLPINLIQDIKDLKKKLLI